MPSLRIRSVYLALPTLAVDVAAEGSFFRLDLFGARRGINLRRPTIGPFDLDHPLGRGMGSLVPGGLAAFMLLVRNIHGRRSGPALLAVRETRSPRPLSDAGASARRCRRCRR